MMKVRLKILNRTFDVGSLFQRFITKLIAVPTTNKNDGNTRSVGVHPFQSEWFNGAKALLKSPGVFTMIIKHTVIPLKTSRAINREVACFVIISYQVFKR